MRPSEQPDRIVVKIGTSSLISGGRLDATKADAVVTAAAELFHAGLRPVLVTSGAIALGRERLATAGDAADRARQLAAAVGQGPLFEAFRTRFEQRGLIAGQFLLTPVDFMDEEHRDSTRGVLERALSHGLIPVVNENDAVKVRNNDVLAALLGATLGARMLVLLTDVPGLYGADPRKHADARRLAEITGMTHEVERLAGASDGVLGTGGMISKLCAVWIATLSGVPTVIAGAQEPEVLAKLVRGESVGTLVRPRPATRELSLRRLWRAFSGPPSGVVRCLDVAEHAVSDGVPLLSRHVLRADGAFGAGDVVNVTVGDERVIARGRTRIGSPTLNRAVSVGSADDSTVLHQSEYVSFLEV